METPLTTLLLFIAATQAFHPTAPYGESRRIDSALFVSSSVSTLYAPPDQHSEHLEEKEHIDSQHFHEFWSEPQSEHAIQDHIHGCLNLVNDHDAQNYYHDGASSSSLPLQPRVEILSAEPPLLVIHDFLSSDMCGSIIQAAQDSGDLKRSTTGTGRRTSKSRTSTTVWLKDEQCSHPLRVLAEKVSLISGLPPSHMENLQVCRYQSGQQFNLHTDHQPSFNEMDCRGRLATCLIYLAEPQGGGETWFPDVLSQQQHLASHSAPNDEVLVAPKIGSAVFFFNTVERPGHHNYSPLMDLAADKQLMHAGLPVQGDGEKWICNRWIHPIDLESGVQGIDGGVAAQYSTPRSALV